MPTTRRQSSGAAVAATTAEAEPATATPAKGKAKARSTPRAKSKVKSDQQQVANDERQHVVIIGAGIGGVCLAARLGKLGHRVTVLEKNDAPGGRCSLIHHGGHRWDVGPSLYLMPELFERAFRDLGEDIDDHVQLHLCKPTYKVHFADGERLVLSSDLAEMGPQLERLERPLGNRDPLGSFLGFLKEAGEHYEESVKHVLLKDWSVRPFKLLRIELLPMLWRTSVLHVYRSLYGRASSFFKSPHIRQATTFSSMYMGMSPFHAPATYSLLQYAEYAKGVWYPIGGFQTVPRAFAHIAENKFGVSFRYDTPVQRIVPDYNRGQRVHSVQLEDGETIEADAVVCNADLVWAYNNLLPSSPYTKRLDKLEQTCSSISFYWSLKEVVPELTGHNIFLATAYQASFDEIFDRGELPSQPSFYINVPSRLDPSAAPKGKDTVVVLVPCGPLRKAGLNKPGVADTPEELALIIKRARAQVIETISARIGRPDFASLIEHEIVNDPFTWREKYNLFRGSILGLSHTLLQVLCLRPSTQHSRYRNLFFVGASTQPGTGVPVVVAGSEVVAAKVDRYLRANGREASTARLTAEYTLMALSVLLVALFAYATAAGLSFGPLSDGEHATIMQSCKTMLRDGVASASERLRIMQPAATRYNFLGQAFRA